MAIAFGAVGTQHSWASGTTLSWTSQTISGSNVLGLVHTFTQMGSGTYDTITGITWNGVAMSKLATSLIADNIGGVQGINTWGLVGATTGTITITWSSAPSVGEASDVFYTGVSQTGLPDATHTNYNNNTTQLSDSVTTVADNAWVAVHSWSERTLTVNGSTFTARLGSGTQHIFGDFGPKTPAGSVTATVDLSASQRVGMILVSFAPVSATSNNLVLLGCGI